MKQILYILGFVVLLSGIYTSCKTTTLDSLRQDELVALDKYVKDNNLTNTLDASGIYFKNLITATDTTWIRKGFKVMLHFKITLLDGAPIPYAESLGLTTDDGHGHNYEEFAFFVDVSNTIVDAQYVQQIAGMHLGLKKMRVGETAFMVIPSELAFKAIDKSSIGIPRFSTLLVTVTAVKGYSPAQQKADSQ
jgi:hypothetical protein